jgi:hypothetical protein
MKSEQMTYHLDNISLDIFGRSRSLAMTGLQCVACGKRADRFRDELSAKEYDISGMCQECQDSVFNVPDEELP